MKRVFIIILLTKCYVSAFSQISFSHNLNWQIKSISEKEYLWFNGASYPSPDGIPYFFETLPHAIPIKKTPEITINSLKWEVLNNEERQIANTFDFKIYETTKKTIIVEINGKRYVQLLYPAIRKTPNGIFEKLTGITYTVNISDIEKINITPKNNISNSVLSTGKWVKVGVTQSGIHKISYSELVQMGLSDPANISLWGNGGKPLPLMNNISSYDAILPIPIYIEKGTDGIFNQGDYILFYAEGPETMFFDEAWGMWRKLKHPYTSTIYYFLTTSQPQTLIETATTPSEIENYTTSTYDEITTFEKNDTNLVNSGREWFGEIFDITTQYSFTVPAPYLVSGSPFSIWARVAARSASSSSFTLSFNNTQGSIALSPVIVGDELANVVSVNEQIFLGNTTASTFSIDITYNKPSSGSVGFLDFLIVQTRHFLTNNGTQLIFRDVNSVGSGKITRFNIGTSTPSVQIWDITNINETQKVPTSTVGNQLTFKQPTESLKTYIAFEPDKAYSVISYAPVTNQNIRGNGFFNYFIVTHPDFRDEAEELAQLHRQRSNLSVAVYTTDEVYNEFSGGNPDVAAIRNMIRYFYRAAQSIEDKPRYLLLFGDGSFDNLSTRKGNTNFVLTYQSERSINRVGSFVTDDFFGLLDDDEGEASGTLDVGIGRLPVSTKEQATYVVSKIRRYMEDEDVDDWQSKLVFIADDEDGNVHMQDANTLAKYIEENHSAYNIQKIFLDAYQQENTSSGQRYPDVTKAINSAVNQGALLVNYTGHGNERWLAHEKVLMLNDVLTWQNTKRLALFVTATCEFSRFDDYHITSTGEWILLTPNGGAVALLSTTRLVYSSPNFTLNYNFIQQLFNTDANGNNYRLGDLVRITKNLSGPGYNKLNFSLLGDPALMLRYPRYNIEITNINGKSTAVPTDTLKVFQKVQLQGEVTHLGTRVDNFNGSVAVTLYDKAITVSTLSNDGGPPMTFTCRDNIIFKGLASVRNGQFSIDFIVPKDINYSYGNGKISLFAYDGISTALGVFDSVTVGGVGIPEELDTTGPEISIYLNDKRFADGGICAPNPKLIIALHDPSGINTTGIGIGHDLTATLFYPDGKTEFINLNSFYKANIDDYTRGTVSYQLTNLTPGTYVIDVKAWDVFNNSNSKKISFRVTDDNNWQIDNFYCSPNPVSIYTNFYFESNQTNESIDITIDIYDVNGSKVAQLYKNGITSEGYKIGPFEWHATNGYGAKLAKGLYIARLTAQSKMGTKQYSTKIVIQ